MGKFRVRVSHKGKRWKKGHSSSSNPTASKHRDAAHSHFFQENLGDSNLTKDAVEKHDAFSTKKVVEESMEEEIESLGGKTFKTFDTFASDWSACSNLSFSKLLLNFKSNSAVHKEMLAILAAITEVIKENGGKESSTEYFGALMTALDSEDNSDVSVLALLSLLGMGIKSVPQPVLQLKFSETSKIFLGTLTKYAQSDNVAILRPILGCISVLLRAQEAVVWCDSSTLNVLDSMLAFVSFSKPKVRKAAQHGVTVIVRNSNITPSGISHVAKHCIRLVESVATGGVTTTLHTLTFLKDILHTFPKKELKECTEAILKVMTMNNVLLTSCGMQALHGMLAGRPPPSALPSQRNGKLITALYDYQPPPTDSQPTLAWLAVMQEAYLNLAKTDLGLCMMNLPKLFSTGTELYLSEKAEILSSVTRTLEAALDECVTPAATPATVSHNKQYIAKIVAILQSRLGYQYHAAWAHVLHLMAALFKACGATCTKTVLPIVKILAELRDSYQFAYVNELDNAVGSAVRAMGPKPVLEVIPLQIQTGDKNKDFKRSWLLPVLKDNIKCSPLQFFTDYFLPLATTCRNESERLKAVNDQVGALSYDLMQSQIWSLLPSFSNQPSDIPQAFPVIAKSLGGVLSTRKDLRMVIMAALRKLVTYSLQSSNEEDKNIMGRFAKNYLPILFNIYTTQVKGSDEEGTRLAALETIKVYLRLADNLLLSELFQKAFSKLNDEKQENFMKESILDLLRALLPYQTKSEIQQLYPVVSKNINEVEDHTQQKKYYRLLEELCTAETSSCKEFLSENVEEIKGVLLSSLSKAVPSSKGARLRCLLELLKKCDNPDTLIESIIPEAVLCVKDVNTKCRETAYKLLEVMADAMDPTTYIEMAMAGLSGGQSLMASTLLALSAIVYHYKDKMPKEIEEKLLYNVGILAICSSREVVGAALSFIKVYIQAFHRDKIAPYVSSVLELFSKMTEDCMRHNRIKIRDILGRFVRWYGGDPVLRLAPPKDEMLKTRIRNLGKIHDRKKKIREEQRKQKNSSKDDDVFTIKGKPKSIEEILAESDSEIEYMEEDDEKPKKKAKGKAWITETGDDIIDFTDAAASKKISASKPGINKTEVNKKKNTKREFKTAPDGRLIIADESDPEEDKGNKKKSIIPGLDSDSEVEDDYEPSETDEKTEEAAKGRKRTLSISTSASTSAPNKYQAGGSGIHRPISKIMAKKQKQKLPSGPAAITGEVYRSGKAKGDMKRKGLPDPYAYVPLRRDVLNKRKRIKQMGQFKNIIRGARKGVHIGLKNKMRKKK